MQTGMIGLGRMGGAMADRLLDLGVDLVVHDVDRAAVDRLVARGAHAAHDIVTVTECSEVVLLVLPDSTVVEAAAEGPRGLLNGTLTDRLILDLSSSRPDSTRRLHAAFGSRGAAFVDAPVSRGVPAARAGELSIFVGGEPEAVERALPVLGQLGTDILPMGGPGTGHAAKALNNLLNATTVLSSCEVLAAAHRAGLDIDAFTRAVNVSSGRSYATEVKWPRHILPGRFDSGFSTALMAKDVAIALDLLRSGGTGAVVSAAVDQAWQAALARLGAEGDHTQVMELIEEGVVQ